MYNTFTAHKVFKHSNKKIILKSLNKIYFDVLSDKNPEAPYTFYVKWKLSRPSMNKKHVWNRISKVTYRHLNDQNRFNNKPFFINANYGSPFSHQFSKGVGQKPSKKRTLRYVPRNDLLKLKKSFTEVVVKKRSSIWRTPTKTTTTTTGYYDTIIRQNCVLCK